MQLVPDGVFSANPNELRRYPPELRFQNTLETHTRGPLESAPVETVIFEVDQLRHSAIQTLATRATITQADAATQITGFELLLEDLNFNAVATLVSIRNLVSQSIIGDTGLVSSANAGFIASYFWNLKLPFLVPSGHHVRVRAQWARLTNPGANATLTIQASVGSISFPEGNLVR